MIRDIKIYPSKILSQKTKKVGEIDAETKKLIEDMVETLYAKGGAGLAANQVGEPKRILVYDASEGPRVFINPKILRKKGKQTALEGCLSLPGLELEIKRPAKIEVEYYSLVEKERTRLRSVGNGTSAGPVSFNKIKDFEKKRIKTEGLAARIICHEIDHLDGKTILDRISLFKRLALKRKLKKN